MSMALSYLTSRKRLPDWQLDDWLSRKDASLYLTAIGCPTSVRALEKRASNNNAGKGPSFTRSSWKCVKYKRADLDAWAQTQVVRVD